LGLRTDASYRFERGADVEAADMASRRAVRLILELAGGTAAPGVVDAWPVKVPAKEVALRPLRVRQVLGIEIPEDEVWRHLTALGLSGPLDRPGGATVWRVPTWRVDLKQEIDLVEEVARLHGVDRIPSTAPRGAKGSHPFDATYDVFMELRRMLTGLGLGEAQGQTLVSGTSARQVAAEGAVVALANPLSSDMDVLRPSLIPGLMDVLRHNMARRNADVRLFEFGRVFTAGASGPVEGWRLAIAMTGARNPAFWTGADRDAKCDLSDVKGAVEEVLEWFGLRGVAFARRAEPTSFWVESATMALGGKLELGQLGQVLPSVARRHDLRDPVVVAELNLDVLLARRNAARSAKPLAAFPASQRDVAMVVDESVTDDAVLAAVRAAKPANLETVELFDVFRGRHVPEGQKSLAYSFTYRAADRTLKDEEVTAAHQRVVEAFRQSLKATIRE
jgi:phenylalanyl-tRNA synthetase beta chain